MNKFYAVKLLQDGIEVGYLGFDTDGEAVCVSIRSAAFYDVLEDVKYDANLFSTENPEYTTCVIVVEINEVAV